MDLKSCTKCKTTKPTSEFWASRRYRCGLMSRCKDCHRAAMRAVRPDHAKVARAFRDGKVCNSCRERKPAGGFAACRSSGDGLFKRCRECQNSRSLRAWRARGGDHRNKRSSRRELLLRVRDRACADCGGYFGPWAMEFDHRDAATKLAPVSTLATDSCPEEVFEAEISKCDIVCANCHRNRTQLRHWIRTGRV